MPTVEAKCPKCHITNPYGEELVGRYTLCHSCNCRFYVEVPLLGGSKPSPIASKPRQHDSVSTETTLDELLWDTQQGSKLIIKSLQRQEQRQQQIVLGLMVVGALLVVNILILILR